MKKNKRTPAQNRRYKLHEVVKSFVKLKARSKTAFTCENELSALPARQSKAINELCSKFGYNIQLEIR